ncbi:MAG: ferritin family protein [Planctomycetes bacterium]|jgi:rubrerythrin|nr:ferritin family protein [Planctomycetota bacterium]
MKTFGSVEEVLDYAIGQERKAARFYDEMAGEVSSPAMKDALVGFAAEERGHEAKLRLIKEGKTLVTSIATVKTLGISEVIAEAEFSPNMSYQEVLKLAMQKEKAAYKLYSDLAAAAPPALRDTFLMLAAEEAKHKLRFEIEYDDSVLTEN